MAKCRTEDGKPWSSKIRGVEEGQFRILTEDADGFCKGVYVDNATSKEEEIRGRCNGFEIYFLRPTDGSPRYYYEGRFAMNGNISGSRTPLPKTPGVTLDSEEWQGTKIGAEAPAPEDER